MTTLAIGLMSGTSCDGISAALVRIQGSQIRVIAEQTSPYPARLLRQLRDRKSVV